MKNEFTQKEMDSNLESIRVVPVSDVIDCVESKKVSGILYPSNNVIVFVDGRVAFGEWLVGDE